jgi:hypothetical protein
MELPLLSTFDDGEVCVKRPAEAVDLESKISIAPSAVCVFLCFGLFASNSSMYDIRYTAQTGASRSSHRRSRVVRTVFLPSFVRCSYRRSYGVRTGVRTVVRTVACTGPVAWSNNYLQIILNLTVFQRKHNEGGLGSTGRLPERREHRQVSLRCPWFVSFHPNELDPRSQ